MSATTEIKEDIYRFGWRDISTKMPDGTVRTKRIPLTLKDCLYPEEGDVMATGRDHEAIIRYLAGLLERRLDLDAGELVNADCQFRWGHPTIGNHSPDIAVTFGVSNPDRDFQSFDVMEEGVKPSVIIEVVSPNVRQNDVTTKVNEYHQLGIPWYFIVDWEDEDGPRSLIGYRYAPLGYVRLKPADDGRLWVEALNLWMEAKERSVVCYDGKTGQRILGEKELERLAEHEKTRADAAEARFRELEAKLAGQ